MRREIAYIAPQALFFVKKDIEALRTKFTVHDSMFRHGRALLLPFDLVVQLFFLARLRVRGVKQLIAHFAGHHTVLPVLLGFDVHIIIAGSDACSFPGINYGSFRKTLMGFAMGYSMRGARTLLPVHDSLRSFVNSFSTFGPEEQGYERFVAGARGKSKPVPYGFRAEQWQEPVVEGQRSGSICVAFGASPGNAIHFRKGIDLIQSAAERMPNERFTVVGVSEPKAYHDAPPNMHFTGVVQPAELRALLASHSIYLQPSVMEGFPNALCEAMLMGCVPVVSNITSMPDIVGDIGAVLLKREASELCLALNTINALPKSELTRQRTLASQRIRPYTMEARLQGLEAALAYPSATI